MTEPLGERGGWVDAAAREAAAVILFADIDIKANIALAADAIARRVISLIVPLARAEALADLRAEVEGLSEFDINCPDDYPCMGCMTKAVLRLIEKAQHEST